MKVVRRITPSHDHQGMIWDNMTVTTVAVIAVFLVYPLEGFSPVGIFVTPAANITVHFGDEAVSRDEAHT